MLIARVSGVALVVLLSLAMACSSQPQQHTTPQSQPTKQIPTAIPTVAICDTEGATSDLEKISASLGYAFSPAFIPGGFVHSGSSLDRRRRANLVYRKGQGIMLIAYPIEFFKEGSPTMLEIGLIQPADAISEVSIGGRNANVMRGGWSEETILAGPGIDPSNARWDYQRSLTLYFNCETDESQMVGVAIQSIPGASGELIPQSDLINVASSMLRNLVSPR